MSEAALNNKRIAKNTLLLYFRMLFMMLVSLYTSRVVLNVLGVEDFGIYNVVGGIVAMFSVISGAMSSAISRFITYELGKGDQSNLIRIFSASVTIQLLLSLIIVVLIELAGVWFLNFKMNIPAERMEAANWVLQFTIITFVLNLISVPYNAAIIAHEKMSAFAYISILEVLGKLAIAFLILKSPIDKLIFYAVLMCLVAAVIQFTYGYYCKRHFPECTYSFHFDKSILRQMFGFAGWNFLGVSTGIIRDQGGNIIINLFAGPVVNAARGISFQVSNAVNAFITNFMMALNPQIIKSYASGEHVYMKTLIQQGARLSFYMLLVISLPVFVNTHYILTLWLKIVPEHTVLFVQLSLALMLSEALSNPLITAIQATGDIRNYQIKIGVLQVFNIPISYILLQKGFAPETIMVVAVVISQCCLAVRILTLRKMIGLSSLAFLRRVYVNVIVVMLLSAIIPYALCCHLEQGFISFMIVSLVSLMTSCCCILYVGCNNNERQFVYAKCANIIHKFY